MWVHVVLAMVLGIMSFSVPKGNSLAIFPCWKDVLKCYEDNQNQGSKCCALLNQIVQDDKSCICDGYYDVQREPTSKDDTILRDFNYVLSVCNIADSMSSFDAFCNDNPALDPLSVVAAPAPSPFSSYGPPPGQGRSTVIIAVAVSVSVVLVIIIVVSFILYRRNASRKRDDPDSQIKGNGGLYDVRHSTFLHNGTSDESRTDIPLDESVHYEWETLATATNDFSEDCKIGQGGFGSVYKGILPIGQVVAIKRLSASSCQGDEEFQNEVALLARLKHRNLVKLFGYCLVKEEKLLVYEFMPNESLDYFLFDPDRQKELDWPMRFNIIKGIARGLLYLHEDAPTRIIHRDLKSGNILLDDEMNPKVADFGLARMIDTKETHFHTMRVIGTTGYMAPEFLIHGQVNLKSDVYSFGVLVLEIVSGKGIRSFKSDIGEYLPSYGWKCWNEGRSVEFMDPTLKKSYVENEIAGCIQLGLLCAQEETRKRPPMSTVVLTLNSDFTVGALAKPQNPASLYSDDYNDQSVTASSNTDSLPRSLNRTT